MAWHIVVFSSVFSARVSVLHRVDAVYRIFAESRTCFSVRLIQCLFHDFIIQDQLVLVGRVQKPVPELDRGPSLAPGDPLGMRLEKRKLLSLRVGLLSLNELLAQNGFRRY